MSGLKIFGWTLIIIGALIAIKFKLLILGVGVAIAALFIHFVFNKMDAYIKDPQTRIGFIKIKTWILGKFKRKNNS